MTFTTCKFSNLILLSGPWEKKIELRNCSQGPWKSMATSWKVGWLSLRCNWNFSYIALKRLCKGSRRFFWEFENLNLIQLAITTTLEPGNLKIGNRKFVSSICQGDGTRLELVSRMMMVMMVVVMVLVILTCQGEGTRAPGWSWWRTARRRVPQPELSVQDWSFYSPAAATKSYKPFVSASLPPPINLKEGEKNFGGYSFHMQYF